MSLEYLIEPQIYGRIEWIHYNKYSKAYADVNEYRELKDKLINLFLGIHSFWIFFLFWTKLHI